MSCFLRMVWLLALGSFVSLTCLDEAGIDPFLLEQLHTQLSSTPTRKQTTRIVAFDLHLGSHIDSYLILNLLSTVQQQRFAFLQALNLEDCLVGPDGVSVISSAMMNNELPQLKWLNLNSKPLLFLLRFVMLNDYRKSGNGEGCQSSEGCHAFPVLSSP